MWQLTPEDCSDLFVRIKRLDKIVQSMPVSKHNILGHKDQDVPMRFLCSQRTCASVVKIILLNDDGPGAIRLCNINGVIDRRRVNDNYFKVWCLLLY